MRLDKFLADKKLGSRKEVKTMIKEGLVFVDQKSIKDPSFHIYPTQVIKVNNEVIDHYKDILLMMNKPAGYVCATKDNVSKTVFDLIHPPYHNYDLRIVGRLDKDTEGLLLLTNNGKIIHHLTSPKKDIYKMYYVETNDVFKDLERLTEPFFIKDSDEKLYQPLKPIVNYINDKSFYISIQEGKFHQIKRMISYFGYEVTYLKRIRIGDITLDETLPLGGYKEMDLKGLI
jgi:16S rRNA pseudouridine516 synthase